MSDEAPAAILIIFHALPHFTKSPKMTAGGIFYVSYETRRKKDRERTAAPTATNKHTHTLCAATCFTLIIVKTVIIHVEQVK